MKKLTMSKKTTKIVAIVAASVIGATGIGLGIGFGVRGCSSNNGGGAGGNAGPTPINTVTEQAEHKVSGTLHKVNITAGNTDFINDGTTEYSIVVPQNMNDRATESVALIKQRIYDGTGADISIVENDGLTWSSDKKWIVVNDNTLFEQAELSVSEDLGETGYALKTSGDTVFLHANTSFGTRFAALKFLHYSIGYEMYADDLVEYTTETTIKMPIFDVAERPDFDYFTQSDSMTDNARTGMGYMGQYEILVSVKSYWHNSYNYLNPNDNWPEEYFSPDKSQLCYTARGDDELFDQMTDDLLSVMVTYIDNTPDVNNITITIEDNRKFCTCEACTEMSEHYGGSNAAAVIRFCNAVSDKLDAYFEEIAERDGTEKRSMNIFFFAYYAYLKAPATQNENGEWVAIDGIKCNDNVGAFIAPIGAYYTRSFYHEDNKEFADAIVAWSAICEKYYFWLYETGFQNYMYPYNSFDAFAETLRFCKINGGGNVYSEGQFNQNNATGFTKLKEYYHAKVYFDVNTDFSDVCDSFFDGYFGPAAEPMRKFFDEMHMQLRRIENEHPEVPGNIFDFINKSDYWPRRLLNSWLEYCEEAYAAIEPIKATDPQKYQAYKDHICIESLFPRYALLELYPTYYTDSELAEQLDSFKTDTNRLGLTQINEFETIEDQLRLWEN